MGQPVNAVRWPLEALWEGLSPLLPDFTLEALPSIDSTNTELMRRARAGRMEPVLLVAQAQTAGKGRLGRQWVDGHDGVAPGNPPSLLFSLGLPLALTDWSGLSLAVGLAVAECLHPALQIKWPNDVWLQGRKMAGILIETANVGAARYAVIGVGVNIVARESQGLATPPAWLQELRPEVDAPQALGLVAPALVKAVRLFERSGFAAFADRYGARDLLKGQTVHLSDGRAGEACGVDASGALLVHTGSAVERITSSEVSVRPSGALRGLN